PQDAAQIILILDDENTLLHAAPLSFAARNGRSTASIPSADVHTRPVCISTICWAISKSEPQHPPRPLGAGALGLGAAANRAWLWAAGAPRSGRKGGPPASQGGVRSRATRGLAARQLG